MAAYYYLLLAVLYTSQALRGNWPTDVWNPTNIRHTLSGEPHSNTQSAHLATHQDIYKDLDERNGMFNITSSITNCPKTCQCSYDPHAIPACLLIEHCSGDPRPYLPELFHSFYKTKLDLRFLYNPGMSSFPCELTMLPKLVVLTVHNSPIQSVPCNLTGLYRLEELGISYTNLKGIHLELLPPSLRILDLRDNRMEKIVPPLSTTLPKLELLFLDHNRLTELPDLSQTSLERLSLSYNRLTELPDLSWKSLLATLYVDYNRIHRVVVNLLPRVLSDLSLEGNNISTIHMDLSHRLELYSLDLSHNRLYLNTDDSLSHFVSTSQYVDLSYNKLETVSDCVVPCKVQSLDMSHNSIKRLRSGFIDNYFLYPSHLTYLFLDYNDISVIETGAFRSYFDKGLEHVVLSHNQLTSLDSWPIVHTNSRQNGLLYVDVSYNSISKFTNHVGTASDLCHHIYPLSLTLENNKITHIMDVFNGWGLKGNRISYLHRCLDTVYFNVSANPLTCDCGDYEIYNYLHKSKYMVGLVCSTPLSLHGKDPLTIPLDSFVCPIHKDCPNGCTCRDSPHTKSIQLNCDNYTARELPSMIPQLPMGRTYHLDFTNGNLKEVNFHKYLQKSQRVMFSHNAIVDISRKALLTLANVEYVQLANNHLKSLSKDITNIILNTTRVLTLSNNPWHCDCEALGMKNWIYFNRDKIPDANTITCHLPLSISGQKILDLDDDIFCPKVIPGPVVLPYILVGCTMALFFIIMPVAIVLVGAKRGRHMPMIDRPAFRPPPKDECENEDKEFDVYVSYDYRDEEYGLKWLIPELEKRGFKVCFQLLHADPCESEITNLFACINRSKRVLVFFTYNLLSNNLSLNEWNTAYNMDIHNGTTRLVTILDTDININYLEYIQMQYFGTRPSILREERFFWQSLVYSLAIERMGNPPIVDDEGNYLPAILVYQE